MATRIYPRIVWVLTPSYNVKQVTVAKRSSSYGGHTDYGDVTTEGKSYRPDLMHATKTDAIKYGEVAIAVAHTAIEKRVENLNKKRANLTK